MHLSNNPIKIVRQSPNNLQNYSQENSTNIQIKETSLNNEYESKHVKKRTNSFDVVEKDVIFNTEEDPVFIAVQTNSSKDRQKFESPTSSRILNLNQSKDTKSQAHTRLPRRDHQANDYGLINEAKYFSQGWLSN